MMNYEEKVLQNVVKQFDGMSKLQAYDILYKMENLLKDFNTPIDSNEIQKFIKTSVTPKSIVTVNNSDYYYLEDESQYMQVYKLKSIFSPLFGLQNLYFTLPNQYKLIALNNRNIEKTFSNTPLVIKVKQYLKKHNAKKRNPVTKRLMIMEFFDQVDPY